MNTNSDGVLASIIPNAERPIFTGYTSEKIFRNTRKGGTASLRSRTCAKHNAVFGARFKGLSLHFLYQKGNLIRIKTGLDTYLIRIQTRTPLSLYPPYDYSKIFQAIAIVVKCRIHSRKGIWLFVASLCLGRPLHQKSAALMGGGEQHWGTQGSMTA